MFMLNPLLALVSVFFDASACCDQLSDAALSVALL